MKFQFHRNELDLHVGRMGEETRREILRESVAFERTGRLAEDAVLRRETDAFMSLMPARPNAPALLLPMMVNAVHRFYAMGIMEARLSAPEPWRPGDPVTAETHVQGQDFRAFYQEGWDPQWWHEDADIPCEDERGDWILPDEGVYPLASLGYLAWQGPDRGSDWTGQTRASGEMIPIWQGFARWAADQAPDLSSGPCVGSPEP